MKYYEIIRFWIAEQDRLSATVMAHTLP